MLRFKVHRTVKGSIAIYILFWGILCISMMLIGFTLEAERNKNIGYLKNQLENADAKGRYREELFSDLYAKMLESGVAINQDAVNQFILDNCNSLSLVRQNSKLYFKSDGVIIIRYMDADLNNVFECFTAKVIDSRLKFIKIQSGVLNQNYEL
jgi:hypothetical protein